MIIHALLVCFALLAARVFQLLSYAVCSMQYAVCSMQSTPTGFEPVRAEPNGLAGRRLNHEASMVLVYDTIYFGLARVSIDRCID